MYNLGIAWRDAAWDIAATYRHVGKRYNQADNSDTIEGVPGAYDPYTLTDVKATYHFSPKHSASLGVNNLFDEKYYDFYRAAGRFWFAELRADY
jgi:iron complex outermembrane receptor protein